MSYTVKELHARVMKVEQQTMRLDKKGDEVKKFEDLTMIGGHSAARLTRAVTGTRSEVSHRDLVSQSSRHSRNSRSRSRSMKRKKGQ